MPPLRRDRVAALFGEALLHLVLELLEGAHFDLAHALAGDAVFLRELFQRRRIVAQTSRLDDVALAVGQLAHGRRQQIVALVELFGIGEAGFLVDRLVGQPILPFGFGIRTQGRVERGVRRGEAKVTPSTSVVVLPWQVASNAQQFGRDLAQEHKKAVIFGTDGLFSPGTFTINGSYVSSFGPDIHGIAADAPIVAAAVAKNITYGTFGPPVFAATHVLDDAIAKVCQSGQTPTRANVMAAVKTTNEPTSILGQSISFTSNGDLTNGKFFLFKIDAKGSYNLIPG